MVGSVLPPLHAKGMGDRLADGLLWGVAPDHVAGLAAAILAPVVVWAYVGWQRAAATGRSSRATRFVAGIGAAPLPVRACAFLLVVSALVHAALAPGHVAAEPWLAALFALDAVVLGWVAVRTVSGRRWRFLATVAITGSQIGYVVVVLARANEAMLDEVGLATKLVELAALACAVIPPRRDVSLRFRRMRRVMSVGGFLLLATLTGVGAWAAAFATEEAAKKAALASGDAAVGHGMVGMVMQPETDAAPTASQRAAAERLVADTRAGIARYADVAVALADGYRAEEAGLGAVVHYEHPKRAKDGRTLNPSEPEMLVYAHTAEGPRLLGAVYSLAWPLATAPDAGGGGVTAWHAHTNVCFGVAGLVGLLSPFGTCPAGSVNIAGGPMLHVWTAQLPGGPFGLEPEEGDVAAWLAAGAP